jgi:hypothetical protein
MNTKVRLSKRKDVRTEIVHVVKLSVRGAYIKVTEKSLTTSGTTVLGDLRTYQLVWYLGQLIVAASRHGIK